MINAQPYTLAELYAHSQQFPQIPDHEVLIKATQTALSAFEKGQDQQELQRLENELWLKLMDQIAHAHLSSLNTQALVHVLRASLDNGGEVPEQVGLDWGNFMRQMQTQQPIEAALKSLLFSLRQAQPQRYHAKWLHSLCRQFANI